MKKGKIIGIAIASFGVIASVGGAIALYTKAATEVKFGFGKFNYTPSTDDLYYYLGAKVEAPDVVTDTTITKKYSVPMSAVYPNAGGVIAQDYRAGNIAVSFSSSDESLRNHVTVSAAVKGYKEGSYLVDGETVLSATAFTGEIVSGSKDVTVKAGDDTPTIEELCQYLEITMVLTGKYTDFNEAAFNISVTWDKPSAEYVAPYIRGSANDWKDAEEYQMVKFIDDATEQWTFKNLTGFEALKIHLADGSEHGRWIGDGEYGNDNVAVNPEYQYQVYWKTSENSVTPNDDKGVHYISHK